MPISLRQRTSLLRRSEVDCEAFHLVRSAISQHPGAQFVLVNDQAAMWSARAMLELAGIGKADFEILPMIGNFPSADMLRDFTACPFSTDVTRLPTGLQLRLVYPVGCRAYTFGYLWSRYGLHDRALSHGWQNLCRRLVCVSRREMEHRSVPAAFNPRPASPARQACHSRRLARPPHRSRCEGAGQLV